MRWTVVPLIVLFVVLAVAAEPTRQEVALGLVEALVAGDAEGVRDFLEANVTPEKWEEYPAEHWDRISTMLARDMKDGEVVGIETEDESRVRVEVAVSKGIVLAGLKFTADAPYRIAGLDFSMRPGGGGHERGPRLPPPDLEPGMSREQVVAALEAWFTGIAEKDIFSGTALVAVDGEPIFAAAHGMASHRFQVPNTLATRFDIGSINKSFTKVAIGQLMVKGKLKLTDTVVSLLPDYPNPEVAKTITVGQLVEHTSGLGDIFNERFFESSKGLYRTPRDYFPLFADEPLLFEPGTDQSYSNAGYVVLGAIIEAVAGKPYHAYVIENIFEPAGMENTGFFAHDEPVPDVAIGYTRRSPGGEGELRNNLLVLPVKGSPAGSAYATAEDLLRYDNALRDHKLLPPAYTRWVFGGPTPDPAKAGEGSTERLEVGAALAGGAPGVSALLHVEGPVVLVVLSNYDAPVTETIGKALMRPLTKALK